MSRRRLARRRPRVDAGFDTVPDRPALVTAALVVIVSVAAAAFAELFRHTALWVVEQLSGHEEPTAAAGALAVPALLGVVLGTVLVGGGLGRLTMRRWPRRAGVEAIAASARGEDRPISQRATWTRTAATWLETVGLSSVGRESAIVETGGALGSLIGRRTGGRGDALAAAGIASAFAAAYHAPVAAVLYVEEALDVHASRRGLAFTAAGALLGFTLSTWVLGTDPIFPTIADSRWALLGTGLVVLVPAAIASRLLLQVRTWLTERRPEVRRGGYRRWALIGAAGALAAVTVAAAPLAAGNGMDALRTAPLHATWTLALALAAGKFVGTAAVFATGAPGGVLTPTMAVAGGWALIAVLGLGEVGVPLAGPWTAIVGAMAVAVTVGLRAPLLAVVLIPELTGDYTLLPAITVLVALAALADRLLDAGARRLGRRIPAGVHDEDA